MPKEYYEKQLKELKELKKDGKKIAIVSKSIINQRIKKIQFKLNKYKVKMFRR